MELTPFVNAMRRDLSAATALADEPTRNVVERLGTTLDTTARLAMFDALSQACAEISRELSPGAVEVRLAGRDPQFVVTTPPRVTPNPPTPPLPPVPPATPVPPAAPTDPTMPLATAAPSTAVSPVEGSDEADDDADEQYDSDGSSARITLRLPAGLKARVDVAASKSGVSVNAWLVQAVQDAVDRERGRGDRHRDRDRDRHGRRGFGIDLGLGLGLDSIGAEISRGVNEAMREVNREMRNVRRDTRHTPGSQVTGWFR